MLKLQVPHLVVSDVPSGDVWRVPGDNKSVTSDSVGQSGGVAAEWKKEGERMVKNDQLPLLHASGWMENTTGVSCNG